MKAVQSHVTCVSQRQLILVTCRIVRRRQNLRGWKLENSLNASDYEPYWDETEKTPRIGRRLKSFSGRHQRLWRCIGL